VTVPTEPNNSKPAEGVPHWSENYDQPERIRVYDPTTGGVRWASGAHSQSNLSAARKYTQQMKVIERYPSNPIKIGEEAWRTAPRQPLATEGFRGFWENPQNVVRYKQMSDAGIAPTWVDRRVVDSAYLYLSNRMRGTPKTSWAYLPEDDPASKILRAMPAPVHPDDIGIEEEYDLANPINPIISGDYNKLGWAQQIEMLTMNKGTAPGMSESASKAQTWLSPLVQAGMMGFATLSITKSPIAAMAVTGVVYATEVSRNIEMKRDYKAPAFDPKVQPKLPQYKRMTDEQWNSLSLSEKRSIYDAVDKWQTQEMPEWYVSTYDGFMERIGKIFDIGSRPAEQVIGAIAVAIEDDDMSAVLDYVGKEYSKELRETLKLTYEVGTTGDLLSDIAGFVSGKGTTKKGEMWQTYKGIADPVKVDFEMGGGALDDMRNRIIAGENAEDVMAEYEENFGAEGLINDFVYQSLFDPLALAPVAGAKAMEGVGKIAKEPGLVRAGKEAGWNFSNKKTIGRMVADIIPGASIILPGLSKGKIQPSTGILGALSAYKSFLHTDFIGGKIAPSKLSRFAQVVGGLTREGKMKAFEPTRLELLNKKPSPFKNPIKYFSYLSELSAVSKAFMYGYHTQDAIISLFEMGGYKPETIKTILTAAAQADGKLTMDQISAILDPMKDQGVLTDPRYFNSPIAASVHDGIKFFVENHLDIFINMFDAVAKNRKSLGLLAEIFDTTTSKVIRFAKDGVDFGSKAKTIQDPARLQLLTQLLADNGIANGDIDGFIKTELAPFTKKGAPDLYSEELFGRGVAQHFGNTMGEWIAGRYGITHDPTFQRFSGMLKSAQSILLLGWNPRYLINNEINNVVTRVATGIWGYVPRIQGEIDAYGIDLNRMDVKANMKSQGSDIGGGQFQKGIGNRNVGADWGWIERGSRFFRSAQDKVGFFSKWSANIESMESTQSLFIPFRDMRERLFRPQLPSDIKTELAAIDPSLPRRVEAAVRAGRNMNEILHNLQGDFILPEEFIGNVARKYADAHHRSIPAEELYTSLANRTGITQALKDGLEKLKDPTEAQILRVFDDVEKNFLKNASKANKESLEAHLEDLRVRASQQAGTRDFTELGRIYEEMILQDQLDGFNHMFEMDNVYQMKGVMEGAHFERELSRVNARETVRFEEAAARNKASFEVLLDTLGVKADDPHAKTIMDAFDQTLKRNKKFFDDKKKIFEEHRAKKFTDDAERVADLDAVRAASDKMWSQVQAEQAKLAERVDTALFRSLGNDPAVRQWRDGVSKLRRNLGKMVNDFRTGLNDPVTGVSNTVERRAAWNKFFMEDYFPAYVQVGFADVDGAQKVFNNRNGVVDYFAERGQQDPGYGKIPLTNEEAITRAGIEQRGAPEVAMVEVQKLLGGGELTVAVEAAGDLIHRMSESPTFETAGYNYVQEKVNLLISVLDHSPEQLLTIMEQVDQNIGYMIDQGRITDGSDAHWDRIDTALDKYVDAHRRLKPVNKVQKLANDIAIAVGSRNFELAKKLVLELEAILDKGLENWVKEAHSVDDAPWAVDMNVLNNDMALDSVIRAIYGDKILDEAQTVPGLVDQDGRVISPNRTIIGEEGLSKEQFIQDLFEEAQRQVSDQEFNRVPPNSAPQPTPQTQAAHETLFEHMLPLLDSIREETIAAYRNNGTKFSSLTPEVQAKVNEWARGLHSDFVTSKYAALKYGQTMRDLSMLNYQQKTNFDEQLNLAMPYQFWFTHTMRNWLLRTVDKSSWYNMYFRWREMQERLEKDGLPTRLNGKLAFPVPFLPDFMGDTVWFDPFTQLLPFAQMFQVVDNFARKGSNIEHGARTKIWNMVSAQAITREQAEMAINNMSGAIWEEAYAAASAEEDKDPLTLASLMISPAMYWTIPAQLISGNKDDISLTPGARTSQALQAQADETWGKGSTVGAVLGGLSWLETNLRKAVGMSPAVAKFGKYGDYYIERELANMAFDGRAGVYDAIDGIVTHSGDLYAEAEQSVARQLSLRTPGMLTIEALRGNASALETINSFFLSFFPLGLLPQGELKYKGIQQEFNKAWEIYSQTGDKSGVIDLYNKYPEMAARTALYQADPEERMKQYIIGKIGDVYYNAPDANQSAIKNALGEDFVDSFAVTDAKPELLSLETLMTYARMLNVMYPAKPQGVDMPNEPTVEEIEMYSEETSAAYQRFVNTRDVLFPFWWVEQQEYFDAKDAGEEPVIQENLQNYWDWKNEYIKKHPEISPVIESTKSVERSKYEGASIKDFDPVLIRQLSNFYVTGEVMSAGAWELLYETWEERGKPQGEFSRWMTREVQPALTGVPPEEESGFYLLDTRQQKMYAEYAAERDKLFPTIKEAKDLYYASEDKAVRRAVVKQYPVLEEYWDWDDEYEKRYPEIIGIKKIVSSTYK